MKKFVSLLLALVLMLTCCAAFADAASDDSLQKILDKGQLIMGLDDSFPPMGYRDENGEIVGFDVDVAREVCNRLGVELVLAADILGCQGARGSTAAISTASGTALL